MPYRQEAEAAGKAKAAPMVMPHGVFEIPALLLAASHGLWLGVTVVIPIDGAPALAHKEKCPIGATFHILPSQHLSS